MPSGEACPNRGTVPWLSAVISAASSADSACSTASKSVATPLLLSLLSSAAASAADAAVSGWLRARAHSNESRQAAARHRGAA
eukprot:366313-Chlamydomonas_euryale.AAC.5